MHETAFFVIVSEAANPPNILVSLVPQAKLERIKVHRFLKLPPQSQNYTGLGLRMQLTGLSMYTMWKFVFQVMFLRCTEREEE